jgi:hypothetical protein
MDRLLKWLDAVLGVTDSSLEERLTKAFWGVLVPLLPLCFGVFSVISRHSKFIGRGGLVDLTGTSALMAGVGYICIALLIHVHIVWEEHPWFDGIADAGSDQVRLL